MFEYPPGFPYRTVATYQEMAPPVPPDLEAKWAQINAEIETLAAEGKTNGVREIVPDTDPTTFVVHRYWLDAASANNWIGYINVLELPILSIIVETQPV